MNLKFILSLTLSLFLFVGLSAQRGQLWELQRMEIPPDQVGHFVQAATQIAEIAKASNLSADHGWHFWSEGYDFIVANPIADFAAFDDPDAWMNAFGEAGKEKLMAVFQQLEKDVAMRSVAREVLEVKGDWSYEPAQAMEFTAGTVYQFRIKPGHGEQFGKMIGTWQELWKGTKFPYAVTAYQTHFGDVGKVEFVVFHDGLANYMGKNSMESLAAKAGKQELHQKALQDMAMHVEDMEIMHINYHPDMSYNGPATTASNR